MKQTNWFLGANSLPRGAHLNFLNGFLTRIWCFQKGKISLAVPLDSHCPQDIRYKTPWLQPLSSLNHITLYLISTVMSLSNFEEFLNFSFCDGSSEIALPTDENLSIAQFLGPSTSASKSDWFSGSELTSKHIFNNSPLIDLDVLEDHWQYRTTPTHSDGSIWVTTGFFAPLPSDIIPDIYKPFDGKIPVKDTYTADIKRYMQRTGKVPNANVFTSENDDVECVSALVLSLVLRIFMNISPSSTVVSCSSSFPESDAACDYAPTTGANSDPTVEVPTPAPKDESPLPSSPGSPTTEVKRKLNDVDEDESNSDNVRVKRQRREQQESDWTRVPNRDYSSKRFNGRIKFRCDLCWEHEQHSHLCCSQGDMNRHMQSEKHSAKAFMCPNPRCERNYTRKDALKRHMASCKHR